MASFGDIQKAVEQEEEVVTVPVYDKVGNPYMGADGKESTISVLGAESKAYRAATAREHQAIVRAAGRRAAKPEEQNQRRVNLAASVVRAWSGWEEGAKAVPVECTPENVRKLLQYEHILRQVEDAINNHAVFFANASGT